MGKAARNRENRKKKINISLTQMSNLMREGAEWNASTDVPAEVNEALEAGMVTISDKLTKSPFVIITAKGGQVECMMDTHRALLEVNGMHSIGVPPALVDYSFALEAGSGSSTLVNILKDGQKIHHEINVDALKALIQRAPSNWEGVLQLSAKFMVVQGDL